MDSLLRLGYIERSCAQCGGSYHLTLLDILAAHRLRNDWQPGRACSECSAEEWQVLSAISADSLEALDAAWARLTQEASSAGLELKAAAPPLSTAP